MSQCIEVRIAIVVNVARLGLVALALLLPSSLAAAPAVRAVPTDVTDERRADSFFSELKVEVKLVGAVMAGAKGLRSTVRTAVDNTGRSLVKKDDHDERPKFDETDDSSPEITLELASPARSARTVRRITGMIEVFVPGRDAASRVVVNSPLAHTGVPLQSEGLGAAGMQVAVWTRDEYLAYKKKHDAAEKAAKSGKDDLGTALGTALTDMLGKMFGGDDDMGPNDITLTILDPKAKLVSVEFEDAAGKKVESDSVTTMGGSKTFSFTKPLPATSRLRFFVLTPASVVKVPLTLSDVPLP